MNEYDETKDEGGKPRARTEAGAGAGRAGALELEASRDRKDSHSHYLSDQISLAARLGGALSLTQTKK